MELRIILFISTLILLGLLVPLVSAAKITNAAPTPHSTYHKGDSYTTVYLPCEIAPPNGTNPPKITITSITNNTVLSSNNLTLTFELTLESPTAYYPITLQGLCYKPSWQSDNITINVGSNNQFTNKTLTFSIPFTNISDGAKSITVYASIMYENETTRESKTLPVSGIEGIPPYGNYLYNYSNYYFIEGSSSVYLTIDTSPTITPSPKSNFESMDILLYTLGTTVLILVVIVGLLIFHKKHKRSRKV